MWPQMVGLKGMVRESFFLRFFSAFSLADSSDPGVSEVLSFLLDLPSGDVNLLRFGVGCSAKNWRCKEKQQSMTHTIIINFFFKD